MNDQIVIEGLDLPVRIGVPEEERAGWQVLRADVCLEIATPFDQMRDVLEETVDYASLTEELRKLAAERPRQLLETLVSELIALCLEKKGVKGAEITLRKRILPGTDAVAVRMKRHA